MSLSEFELIDRFFAACGPRRADVVLGIGDDAALLRVPAGHELVVTLDALVEGVHFPRGTEPAAIGHKALAVNLSDLAAMGADPAWVTLALCLPTADAAFVQGLVAGFSALAERWGVQLVGGDTVRGPLMLALQAHGLVPEGAALRRRGACPGDLVYVSGTLGDAGGGLQLFGHADPDPAARYLVQRLERPEPRLALGRALRGIASAAIDLSDGLVSDLGHILAASGVGAVLEVARLPLSAPLVGRFGRDAARHLALANGDDYELCFTVPPAAAGRVADAARAGGCPVTCVGRIEAEPGLRLRSDDGGPYPLAGGGFDHFRRT